MAWDSDRAERHVDELADRHDVQVIWSEHLEVAYTSQRAVRIRRPNTPERYLGCLHELGHVMSPRARFHEKRWDKARSSRVTEYDDQFLMEAAAWAWAARFADEELLEDMPYSAWRDAGSCLAGYLEQVRHHRIG